MGDNATTKNLYVNNKLITELIIPETVTYIQSGAFYNCKKLTSVVIGNTTTSIATNAFTHCSNLSNVVIGAKVRSIGNSAFYSCDSLTSVYYTGTARNWSGISIGASNSNLTNATRYYYSETAPALNADGKAYNGNYWKYDENGNIVVWVYTNIEE